MPQDSKASGRDHIPDFQNTAPSGVNWLLVIAIDEYEHCAPLSNCVKDAKAITQILTEKYQFDKVETLYNAAANRKKIIAKLNEIKTQIKENTDNLLIYFSGHGETEGEDGDEDEQIGYLVPVDAARGDESDYIPHSFFKEKLNRIKTKHTFVIMDACFSGSFFIKIKSDKRSGREHQASRWGFSSSLSHEVALDGKPGDNSPFAQCLIETLQENSTSFGIHGLAEAVEHKMRERKVRQTPVCLPFSDPNKYKGQFFFHPAKNEAQEWADTEAANTAAAYYAFWQKYPDHPNAEEALWRYACINNQLADFQLYRKTYPQGKYRFEVLDKMDDATFVNATTVPQLRSYLNIFGDDANHAAEAHQRIDDLLTGIPMKTPAREQIADSTPSAVSNLQTFGTFTDKRDGQTYKTVELNGLVWMAENLNFDTGEDCWYYKENGIERREYGRLYTWESALKACPSGWRLPEEKQWDDLMKSFGGYIDKSDEMRIRKVGDGILEEAFSEAKAKLNIVDAGGFRNEKGEFDNDHIASYWSAKKLRYGYVVNYDFDNNSKIIYKTKIGKLCALSVRYVRDPKLDAKLILPKEELITDLPRLPFEPEMVFVKGGTFKMGSNDGYWGEPIHEVNVRDIYIGKYPVTFNEYDAFCEATGRDRRPVIYVIWNDAKDYCEWLSKQIGKNYRLPTEAEWEYAARGGNHSKGFKYAGSDDLNEVAWYDGNSGGKTHPVGEKKPNELGIHDMSGNVWEWCEDVWHRSYEGAPNDSKPWLIDGTDDLNWRVVRGGSWNREDISCRVSDRYYYNERYVLNVIGFRLAGD